MVPEKNTCNVTTIPQWSTNANLGDCAVTQLGSRRALTSLYVIANFSKLRTGGHWICITRLLWWTKLCDTVIIHCQYIHHLMENMGLFCIGHCNRSQNVLMHWQNTKITGHVWWWWQSSKEGKEVSETLSQLTGSLFTNILISLMMEGKWVGFTSLMT